MMVYVRELLRKIGYRRTSWICAGWGAGGLDPLGLGIRGGCLLCLSFSMFLSLSNCTSIRIPNTLVIQYHQREDQTVWLLPHNHH